VVRRERQADELADLERSLLEAGVSEEALRDLLERDVAARVEHDVGANLARRCARVALSRDDQRTDCHMLRRDPHMPSDLLVCLAQRRADDVDEAVVVDVAVT
jgi:hypothetical protein